MEKTMREKADIIADTSGKSSEFLVEAACSSAESQARLKSALEQRGYGVQIQTGRETDTFVCSTPFGGLVDDECISNVRSTIENANFQLLR